MLMDRTEDIVIIQRYVVSTFEVGFFILGEKLSIGAMQWQIGNINIVNQTNEWIDRKIEKVCNITSIFNL